MNAYLAMRKTTSDPARVLAWLTHGANENLKHHDAAGYRVEETSIFASLPRKDVFRPQVNKRNMLQLVCETSRNKENICRSAGQTANMLLLYAINQHVFSEATTEQIDIILQAFRFT